VTTTIERPTERAGLPAAAAELAGKIDARTARVGVIGLGYVGLPLALAFAERGFGVLGFDVDPGKVEAIGRGECYIDHLDGDRLSAAVRDERLDASTDFGRLGEADAILICVPTPLTPQRDPDLSFVEKTARAIAERLRPGQLVVLESTTYPGTTDELVKPLLEAGGLRCGRDVFLAFSPEREDPGRAGHRATEIPKVVGGADPVSGDLAERLYAAVTPRVVRVGSAAAAEATKLTENIFRAVNIALVNELKVVFERMGIDVWEVLDAAESKPFGFMRFDPGPGWGGHCIPIDPFYLAWKAREHGVTARFIELAGETNVRTVEHVLDTLTRALNGRGKPVRGSRVLVLGLAYKRDVADPRESPAFELIHGLLRLGAAVSYHDPHIPVAPRMRSWPDLEPMASQPLTAETLAASDAVLIVTDHSAVDYRLVLEHAPLVVDTRGVCRRLDPGRNSPAEVVGA
jgi:UDP-N-acetyl-D-glucosamine dehydrogenase